MTQKNGILTCTAAKTCKAEIFRVLRKLLYRRCIPRNVHLKPVSCLMEVHVGILQVSLKWTSFYKRVAYLTSFFKCVAYGHVTLLVCTTFKYVAYVYVILQVCRVCVRHSSSMSRKCTSFFKYVAYVHVILQVCRVCVRHSSSVSHMCTSFFKYAAYVYVIQVCRLCVHHSSSVSHMCTSFFKCVAYVYVILQVCRIHGRHS
jgi:hypothetical protein